MWSNKVLHHARDIPALERHAAVKRSSSARRTGESRRDSVRSSAGTVQRVVTGGHQGTVAGKQRGLRCRAR